MQNRATPATDSPQVSRLRSIFDEKFALSRGLVERALAAFGHAWASDFERVLRSLFDTTESMTAAAKGYTAFAVSSMRLQKRFEKSGRYPEKSFSQAAEEVYFNERHMMEEYLPGLLLSHYLWPHHYRQLQFFDSAFLAPLSRHERLEFAEVGVGTGLYSRRVLDSVDGAYGRGFDISPFSCRFAELHVRAIGAADRYTMLRQNILVDSMTPVPWLVCVEVLEHLEDPVAFLRGLRAGLAPGGRAFITAALNAAHTDHIYLYRNAEEVWAHLQAAGFTMEQSFVGAAYAPPGPGAPVPLAAAFVVY